MEQNVSVVTLCNDKIVSGCFLLFIAEFESGLSVRGRNLHANDWLRFTSQLLLTRVF